MDWYPLKLTYHVRAYSFGERLIPEMLGKQGVPEGTIAETWEISDYRDARAEVLNGPLAGRPFHEVVNEYGEELVGTGFDGPEFPLLGKFLDASHMLPVHLHADDETARRKHGEPHGKTEAWHILWAEEDASILAGVRESVSEDELREAFLAEDHDAVMLRHPISSGDTVYVPGGVIHSFGPGTIVFEIQQTSDLGQFVTPWSLYGERLDDDVWSANIDEAIDELRADYRPVPNPGLLLEGVPNRRVVCAAGPHFAMERRTLNALHTEPPHRERCLTMTNVGEAVELRYAGGTETLERATSCVLPAAIGEVEIQPPEGGSADLVVCYVPDLARDVVSPLREAGYSDREISTLGEVTA